MVAEKLLRELHGVMKDKMDICLSSKITETNAGKRHHSLVAFSSVVMITDDFQNVFSSLVIV